MSIQTRHIYCLIEGLQWGKHFASTSWWEGGDYTIALILPEAGDKVVHCEDEAFRAFSVETRANTVIIKGFFFFFFSFFLSSVVCTGGGGVRFK